jgi:hypothetical protein
LFAYIRALEILLRSPEGAASPPEIANFDTVPHEGPTALRSFLESVQITRLFPTLV